MSDYIPALAVLGLAVAAVVGIYAVHLLITVARRPLVAEPFLSGVMPREHALSRYHVRWYAVTMLFLAFDIEMLFMYPWTLVVAVEGVPAVAEMYVFLGALLVGVVYAWREGALRWT